MSRILLLDGDVLAYKASAAIEEAKEWEPGFWTWHCDEYKVRRAIEEQIDAWMAGVQATELRLCLTDYENTNWRMAVLSTYKGKRSNVKKPLVLKPIRAWLLEEHKALIRPTLEGDDVMGILATWSGLKGDKIIGSIDKDMKTVPCLYVRESGDQPVEITPDDADYWHMYQTLMGDQVDGYSGLPGVGPKKAESILGTVPRAQPYLWRAVTDAYEKKGLSEEEALRQARVARILRASDFNFKTKEPILWTPQCT